MVAIQAHDTNPPHELYHIFGLPHHEDMPNPGFPEPPMCGGHPPLLDETGQPMPECIMICGKSANKNEHYRKFSKRYGLCDMCLNVLRVRVAGIEGRR